MHRSSKSCIATGIHIANKPLMNLIDFFIIYLACGAPLSVYYFLHNASEIRFKFFWLKTVCVFFFWMPFALSLLRQEKNFKINCSDFGKKFSEKTETTKKFHSIQKQIEKILLESDLKISIYEFREIVERYIGLTLVEQNTAAKNLQPEAEIYHVTQAKNVELSSICFNRRNRKRLLFHQTEARKDFLRFIEKLSENCSDRTGLSDLSFELVQILKDSEALKNLENIFAIALQTNWRQNVNRLEKDLWKPEEIRKPQSTNPIPLCLPRVSAEATNLRRKD